MPTYETLDYSMRQNKAIERYLMAAIIKRMWNQSGFFNNTAYVGMGSLWFKDFEVMNLSLGVQYQNMYSIEYPNGVARARWNRDRINPGLSVVPGPVQNILAPGQDWPKSLVDPTATDAAIYTPQNIKLIWFDYEQPPNNALMSPVWPASEQLAQPGDVLMLTFATGYERLDRAAQRYFNSFIKALDDLSQLKIPDRMKRFNQREDRFYEERIRHLKASMFAEIREIRDYRAAVAPANEQVLDYLIERFISDELDGGIRDKARIMLRFMIEVTSLTFDGEEMGDDVSDNMLEYLEGKNINLALLNELYTGALTFALLKEIKRVTKEPLETLFNLSYADGIEMLTIALTHKYEEMPSPRAVLSGIFGECQAYNQSLGITEPLQVTVPAITLFERQYLRTLSVPQVTGWLNDNLSGMVKGHYEKGIDKFPFFPALVQLYPALKDVTTQQELSQMGLIAPSIVSSMPPTSTLTGQTGHT